MAGGYQGDPEQFAQAHRDVSATKQDMDSNLATLRSNLENTAGAWDGKAATVFRQVMESFDQKALKINEALQDIADMLQQSGVKYDTSEQETERTISSLGSLLNP